ncbi:hypothetical protein [Vulcanisaeta thermophila]|uniref:hypothetical protein n=1 Tax=Vulcanisaeta thermophila TaxID=867917 RepID=UPI0008529C89|nr:hypothetical protein [Vulcanisaeta thermophila]
MSVSFKTPVTLVMGRMNNEVAFWNHDKGEVTLLGSLRGVELIDELRVDKEVRGHLALASFSYYLIKAVDLGSKGGSYVISEANQLIKLPSNPRINFRNFNGWYTIRNSFILIGNPEVNEGPYPLVCPYRVGDTLFINVGYANEDDLRNLISLMNILRNNAEGGIMTVTTMCRIPSMPVEMALILGNRYLMVRTFINNAVPTSGSKYLVIVTSGGNIVSKYSVNTGVLDALSDALNQMRK